MSTVSGMNSSSRVVPLASGGVCSLVGEPIPPQHERDIPMIVPNSVAGLIQSSVPIVQGGKSFTGLFKSHIIETLPVPSVPFKNRGSIGIGVPLRLDKATSDGDFGHYAKVLVDVDVSSVLPTSVLLERNEFHSSFIVVEYKNLPVFCSTCSSIGHLSSCCRWNKFSKEEVPLSNVFSAIHQDVGGHDSVVVHTSVGSNLISSSTSSAGLVLSSNLSSSTVSTILEVASSSVPPMISQALQISKDSGFDDGVVDSVLVSSSSAVDPSISSVSSDVGVVHYSMTVVQGSMVVNQAKLRLIADSSWASQVEEGELVDAEIAQRALRVERRLASLKFGCRAPSTVFED
ncbi:hypothetical protein LWI28_002511 [Acer negundo]|uniref:Zinc knuckle CX2CX4HX4C domain-containing protein n=1 Tax=Acer negundo TaxID=4023 RepID=A0AAD5NW91_ACENE|nr:hypothetical protein LWI28_002511 [Acer negundo]